MFRFFVIGIIAVVILILAYLKRPRKVEEAPAYIGEIMEKIERSEKMNKNKENLISKEASVDDRLNKICDAIDKAFVKFGGSYTKTEEWIKANVKSPVDAYHAGFYLGQLQTRGRLYSWADIMVFGAPETAPGPEEIEEEDNVFDVVPEKEEPVQMQPVDPQKTKDAIDDFLDKQKEKNNQAGPEVA